MKTLKYIVTFLMGIVLTIACNKGIDPLTHISPGADQTAPVVTVKYPGEGVKIQVPTLLATINIQFEVTDDIELKAVSLLMDGAVLQNYSGFKDYRRAVEAFTYDKLTNGIHILTVRATDLSGKITNKDVSFEKKPPYVPIFSGELFYMPFDGDYVDKVSFIAATKVGNPGFAGESLKGLNAYAGATDSYLTFPLAGLKNNEFSAEMWYKLNAVPDRAGIIAISPTGTTDANFDASRTKGLRFFRESSGSTQRFKLNAGNGTAESWFDGGSKADVPNNIGQWIHLAFTVSGSQCVVYVNGVVVSQGSFSGIDWTGCESISIGSGAPYFVTWGHKADNSFYDELRIFNKALSQSEIQAIIQHDSPYVPKYNGEILYMPFEGNYNDLVSNTEATKVGSPDFADGKRGKAYAGAIDSYLTFPVTEIVKSNQFSSVFWTKVSLSPANAGIIAICPTGAANFDAMRTKGLRIFHEGSLTAQRYKLNVGFGSGESWNDGGLIDPTLGEWVHVAYTVSATESKIYINGVLTRAASTFAGGIDWTGCSSMSIGSGAPLFVDWGHLSDTGLIDELRIFNKALTETEVQTIMNNEK